MPAPTKREVIVTTALRLFAEQGFNSTGIDQVVKVAGVSKKTLYNHFRSKDELILAVLTHYDSSFRNSFIRQVEAAADSPRARLLAIFDVAGEWFSQKNFFGCLFVNAIGEYSQANSPLRRICQGFKSQMRDYILELVEAAEIEPSESVTDELALLLEGAIVTAQVADAPAAAKTAKRVARTVLAAS